jgi:putative addiction module component (TIGR02574 family)
MAAELDDLRGLSIADKLRIVETLWDDIATSNEPFPILEWASDEARRRAAQLETDPEIGLSREELWDRVDREHG